MRWKGRDLETIGDLSTAVLDIVRNGTREDAEAFMEKYSAETPHAGVNVGYLAGYYDSATRETIFDWFGVEHPFFGTATPTVDEAFQAGQQWAAQGRLT